MSSRVELESLKTTMVSSEQVNALFCLFVVLFFCFLSQRLAKCVDSNNVHPDLPDPNSAPSRGNLLASFTLILDNITYWITSFIPHIQSQELVNHTSSITLVLFLYRLLFHSVSLYAVQRHITDR